MANPVAGISNVYESTKSVFVSCPSESVDYAVMEKTGAGVVIEMGPPAE